MNGHFAPDRFKNNLFTGPNALITFFLLISCPIFPMPSGRPLPNLLASHDVLNLIASFLPIALIFRNLVHLNRQARTVILAELSNHPHQLAEEELQRLMTNRGLLQRIVDFSTAQPDGALLRFARAVLNPPQNFSNNQVFELAGPLFPNNPFFSQPDPARVPQFLRGWLSNIRFSREEQIRGLTFWQIRSMTSGQLQELMDYYLFHSQAPEQLEGESFSQFLVFTRVIITMRYYGMHVGTRPWYVRIGRGNDSREYLLELAYGPFDIVPSWQVRPLESRRTQALISEPNCCQML